MLARGFALAASAAFIQFGLTFVPPIGGVSPIADAARTAGLGWVTGIAMRKSGFLSKYADDVTLAGFTLAGGKVISSLILPFANRLFSRGAPPTEEQASMNGIAAMYPGMQPYGRYAGRRSLNGIATWAPGQQPFGQFDGVLIA